MTSTETIRVMLVDDHAVVRSGLAAFLQMYDDLSLVAEAADGEEAVRRCAQSKPDVILMDAMMPRLDGPGATRIIRERFPEVQILILTSFKEDNLIEDALDAGALGYLLKNVGAEELAGAIRSVYRGEPILAPEATKALIQATTQRRAVTLGHDLTDRERDILQLLAKGMDNLQIANTLFVSTATVKFHISNILSKLNASNRTEALVIALEHNLITKSN
jgi:NarL family two-component system response regulator LiaR